MKKVIALILGIIFILSFSIVANAENLNDKLAPDVIEMIEKVSSDTKLPVNITFKDGVDTDELWKKTLIECNIDTENEDSITTSALDECMSIYRKKVSQAKKEYNMSVIQKTGINMEDVSYCGSIPIIMACIESAQLYDLVAYDEIVSITYDYLGKVVITEPLEGLYEEQFINDFNASSYYNYEELYYHYNEDGVLDWVLVNANAGHGEAAAISGYTIGNVAITYGNIGSPFMCNYGLYDVALKKFIDLYDIREDYSKYNGLIEALSGQTGLNKSSLQSLDAYSTQTARANTRVVGDANFDGKVNILDATDIQRILAKLSTYVYDFNYYGPDVNIDYFHDYNADGKMTIMDATAIQRKLAKLD